MKRINLIILALFSLAQTILAQWELTEQQKREVEARPKMPDAIRQEMLAMVTNVNHGKTGILSYQAKVINKMLEEANCFADRLQLPMKRPIEITDIQYPWIASPWFSVIGQAFPESIGFWRFGKSPSTSFGTNIYNSSIPREARLRALKFGTMGTIETTNFEFFFRQGKLLEVMRFSEHEVEYLAHDLDKLVGKPSLIDTNGAYQLATQWLASVNVDVAALEKQFPHSVNQLRYLPHGATNAVLLPIYFVGLGTNNVQHLGNMPVTYNPAVEVEILGTTKELQDLSIARNSDDAPYDHRPLLLITNALDLIRTPNPPTMQLQRPSSSQTNSLTPP
jgi:hypothetical protein